MAGVDVAGGVVGSFNVTVAVLAANIAFKVPVAVPAGVTVLPGDVVLAPAVSGVGVTDGQLKYSVLILISMASAKGMALARVAVLLVGLAPWQKGVTVEARLAGLAAET